MAWSVDTLAAFIRGVLECDPDAAGGTVPDRLKAVVREAGAYLWNVWDWRFRQRDGTLTIAASGEQAVLPADFSEFDHRELRESGDLYPLVLTEGTYRFQRAKDLGGSGVSIPDVGLVKKDWSRGYGYWYAVFTPASDGERTYPFWYLVADPWNQRARLATAFTAADADLLFVARTPGVAGNAVTVAFVAGGALAVTVATNAITVTYVAATTTAAQVKAAVEASTTASALVHVSYAFGQAGTGVVNALATAYLSGPMADSAYPNWPDEKNFSEGWELRALATAQKRFGKPAEGDRTMRDFEKWLEDQKAENDETLRLPNERIEDAMGDEFMHASNFIGNY